MLLDQSYTWKTFWLIFSISFIKNIFLCAYHIISYWLIIYSLLFRNDLLQIKIIQKIGESRLNISLIIAFTSTFSIIDFRNNSCCYLQINYRFPPFYKLFYWSFSWTTSLFLTRSIMLIIKIKIL